MKQLARTIVTELRQNSSSHLTHGIHHGKLAARFLEIGCGPGGLLFSLSAQLKELCEENDDDGGGSIQAAISMIGVDHDAELIGMAHQLLAGRTLSPTLKGEGDETIVIPISMPKVDHMIDFRTADPMCLPAEMSHFDCVVLNDVIDKVSSPNSVLGRLGGARGLVKTGGVLVTISAYQWDEDTTPRALWLGGYRDAQGQLVQSSATLQDRLSHDFSLLSNYPLTLSWQTSGSERISRCYDLNFFLRM